MGPSVKGVSSVCSNGSASPGSAQLNKMAVMPIYGKKILKNLLLQNQESFEAESCYITIGTQDLPSLIKG